MNLAAVGADIERLAKTATTIADSTALVNDMSSDIRTISYLLHPPLLDEAGLSSALTWYIRGFSERSKIEVELRIPEEFWSTIAGPGNGDLSRCARVPD